MRVHFSKPDQELSNNEMLEQPEPVMPECQQNQPEHDPDDIKFSRVSHSRLWDKLDFSKIINHKALDIDTLTEFGLLSQFRALAKRVHIWDFLNKLVGVPVY